MTSLSPDLLVLRALALGVLAVDLFVVEEDVERGLRGVLAVDFVAFGASTASDSSSSSSNAWLGVMMSCCLDLDVDLDEGFPWAFEGGFADCERDGGSNAWKNAQEISDLAARFRCSSLWVDSQPINEDECGECGSHWIVVRIPSAERDSAVKASS